VELLGVDPELDRSLVRQDLIDEGVQHADRSLLFLFVHGAADVEGGAHLKWECQLLGLAVVPDPPPTPNDGDDCGKPCEGHQANRPWTGIAHATASGTSP
jgi:hypothetical protein